MVCLVASTSALPRMTPPVVMIVYSGPQPYERDKDVSHCREDPATLEEGLLVKRGLNASGGDLPSFFLECENKFAFDPGAVSLKTKVHSTPQMTMAAVSFVSKVPPFLLEHLSRLVGYTRFPSNC
jgi:hypothetical protein